MNNRGGSHAHTRNLDVVIARRAMKRHGVFTRAHASAVGFSPRMMQRRLESGVWVSAYPAVYALAGAPRTWRQRVVAACDHYGATARASHGTACVLWALPPFAPGAIELTLPRGRGRTAPDVRVHHMSERPSRDDVRIVDAIPVTPAARTLLDVAGTAPEIHVEQALDESLRRGLVSVRMLARYLDANASRGRAGVTVLRALAEARSGGTAVAESVLETKLLAILRGAGIEGLVAQHEIWRPGRLVARVDVALPEHRIAIEADGYQWHSGRARWEHDLARRNALTELGWRVIHATWHDVDERPEVIVQAVRAAMKIAESHRFDKPSAKP